MLVMTRPDPPLIICNIVSRPEHWQYALHCSGNEFQTGTTRGLNSVFSRLWISERRGVTNVDVGDMCLKECHSQQTSQQLVRQ